MTKPLELNSFAGVRNDVSPERFSAKDLQVGSNIELDETGKPYRRLGTTVLNNTPAHSLWAEGDLAFTVRNGTIHRIMPDLTFVDYGVAVVGERVRYERVNNDVFWSDGVSSGVLSREGNRPWGIIVPKAPVTEETIGSLPAGRYLVAMTFERSTGLESGASGLTLVNTSGSNGIRVHNEASSDPLVTKTHIYVSTPNGELPYRAATLTSADSYADITDVVPASVPVRNMRCGPPPVGNVIGYYRGHVFVAENNYLWYSLPHELELVNRAVNFIGFASAVRTFVPVADGVFIGTDDETSFLQGLTPSEFTRFPIAPYGTVLGTELTIPGYLFGKGESKEPVQTWMSKRGLCAGFQGGQFMNLTGGRYVLPDVVSGASLLKVRGASPQLVTTLFS